MAPSMTREVTKPSAKPSFWRLTTGYSATAVPIPARATMSSRTVPTSTPVTLPEPRIQAGSVFSVSYKTSVGMEMKVMR